MLYEFALQSLLVLLFSFPMTHANTPHLNNSMRDCAADIEPRGDSQRNERGEQKGEQGEAMDWNEKDGMLQRAMNQLHSQWEVWCLYRELVVDDDVRMDIGIPLDSLLVVRK